MPLSCALWLFCAARQTLKVVAAMCFTEMLRYCWTVSAGGWCQIKFPATRNTWWRWWHSWIRKNGPVSSHRHMFLSWSIVLPIFNLFTFSDSSTGSQIEFYLRSSIFVECWSFVGWKYRTKRLSLVDMNSGHDSQMIFSTCFSWHAFSNMVIRCKGLYANTNLLCLKMW